LIKYNKFTLKNGLRVIHHQDELTKLCVLNILYNVGSKHENPDKTGFAHLFEHLMFGGSTNIEDFDTELQKAGGDNNAFTSNDITNYFITLPVNNIETGFWLESDRMLSLDFDEESLAIQKNVVIEEFKERYLNQPYGDIWLKLLPLVYTTHPYKWPTIGKEISHIENATLDDVKAFFAQFYTPQNAVLVVAGNISLVRTKELCEKWFEPIYVSTKEETIIPVEPQQTETRRLTIEADVPLNSLIMAYHIPARCDTGFYSCDLISDLLSGGKSSRLYNSLVKEQKLFSEIDAYTTGDMDPGLFVIEGKLSQDVDFEQAEAAVKAELQKLKDGQMEDSELQKVKNKTETSSRFSDISILNKAMRLAYAEILGDSELVNTEINKYLAVSVEDIQYWANKAFADQNCSIIYYKSKSN